jgi:hypothetical protein
MWMYMCVRDAAASLFTRHEPDQGWRRRRADISTDSKKCERGSNRIGSSRLFEFAKVLDVPLSYFFHEMPMSGRGRKGFAEAGTPFEQEKDPLIQRETLELVRAYYKIREARPQAHLRNGQGRRRRQPR